MLSRSKGRRRSPPISSSSPFPSPCCVMRLRRGRVRRAQEHGHSGAGTRPERQATTPVLLALLARAGTLAGARQRLFLYRRGISEHVGSEPAATRPSGILNNYTGGSVTAAKATKAPFATAADPSVQEDAETFLGVLKGVFPGGTAKWNGRASSSLPALDQNLGASYSYWRVGQYTSFAGYEGVRQGNIFFAGEHCSVDYQGYRKAARPKACARHGRSLRSSAERAGRRLACSWISVAGALAAVGLRPHLFSHRRPQSAERRAQLALDLRARSAQRAAHHLVGRRGGGNGAFPAWGEGRVRLPPPVGRGAGVRGHVSVFPLPQPVERRAFFRTPYGERGRGEGAGVTSAAIRSPSFASATAGSQAAPSIDVTIQRTACDF